MDSDVEVVGGSGYRLPSEAEWEFASRAGSSATWSFGEEDRKLTAFAWTYDDSGGQPHPVGKKIPNQWGLYDMYGNVWEWCWDWLDPLYYSFSPMRDPTGPERGFVRALRGGSCLQGSSSCTSASRMSLAPDDHSPLVGFRLACFPTGGG